MSGHLEAVDLRLEAIERRFDALEEKLSRHFFWQVILQVAVLVASVSAILAPD